MSTTASVRTTSRWLQRAGIAVVLVAGAVGGAFGGIAWKTAQVSGLNYSDEVLGKIAFFEGAPIGALVGLGVAALCVMAARKAVAVRAIKRAESDANAI